MEEALAAAQNEFGGSGPLLVQLYCNDDFISASAGARGETEAEVRERLRLGEAATWSPGKVFIYLPQYAKGTPGRQRRTLFHEYFHSVQFFLADQALPEPEPPLWMVEGSASYFAWYGRSAAEAGEYEPYRKSQIDEARQYGPLESYERSGAGRSRGGLGQAYVLGFLASEYLVAQKGVSALKHDFWSGLSEWREPWPAVFARVFGDSPETFYRKFEAHRATLKP